MDYLPDDDETEYELVMPFVVVTTKGGPYDDEAFAAGWHCGVIDYALKTLGTWGATFTATCRTATLPQIDLIAMKHGYTATEQPPTLDGHIADPDRHWAHVLFAPTTPPADQDGEQ